MHVHVIMSKTALKQWLLQFLLNMNQSSDIQFFLSVESLFSQELIYLCYPSLQYMYEHLIITGTETRHIICICVYFFMRLLL